MRTLLTQDPGLQTQGAATYTAICQPVVLICPSTHPALFSYCQLLNAVGFLLTVHFCVNPLSSAAVVKQTSVRDNRFKVQPIVKTFIPRKKKERPNITQDVTAMKPPINGTTKYIIINLSKVSSDVCDTGIFYIEQNPRNFNVLVNFCLN